VPLEESDPDHLSIEEARELIRMMKARAGKTVIEIKKEKRAHTTIVEDDEDDEDDEEDDGDVTIESETRGRKRQRNLSGLHAEVVDLPDD